MPKSSQRLLLYLSNALTRHPNLLSNLFERMFIVTVQPKPQNKYTSFTIFQRRECSVDFSDERYLFKFFLDFGTISRDYVGERLQSISEWLRVEQSSDQRSDIVFNTGSA